MSKAEMTGSVISAFFFKGYIFHHWNKGKGWGRRSSGTLVSPSADGDQGRCPWTLPAFFCKKLLDRKKFLPMKRKYGCLASMEVWKFCP